MSGQIVTVELRCPVGPKKLFTKLKLGEEFGRYMFPQNWIEFTCSDCSKRIKRETDDLFRVYHRFNFAGELVETALEEIRPHRGT